LREVRAFVAGERAGGVQEVRTFDERVPLHSPKVEAEGARCPLHLTRTGLGGAKATVGAQENMRKGIRNLAGVACAP
jgi:hypothetical protein